MINLSWACNINRWVN